ncbi:MAG: AarF/ABC1/UbiB kinase family protein [Candidatus Diapherotrites archaeon]|uniref:AarF/ABC1/UbiB kinase family protein n=1 Tax=Candidatus Iainarchaeum sp. TaxID=3101447 RepID=A0A938YP78_9ARCH|nr:AarF/ABC1/UbiB kinase family protein [Candidatus Diapherotrites archaeon]
MMSFIETPGDIKRFLEIMRVFLKYGWESAFELSKMKEKFPFLSRLEGTHIGGTEIPGPVKLRKIFEELGPTFIKFGQMLSTRPDLVKEDYIEELKKLQDQAPSFDFVEVKHMIKSELGQPIEKIFKKFETKPVAAASLGQVHFAVLNSGQKVAVKVQRPDIEHTIAEDLRIISFIAGLVEKNIKSTQYYNPKSVAEQFADTIRKELDYNKEAKNAERFARNFRHDKAINIPKIFWKYTGKRVITMERAPGKKISEFYSSKDKALKKRIANKYIDCFFKQILVHGFFQADPHPANIFVLVKKGKPMLSLVDFGMVGRLDYDLRDNFATAMVLIVERNIKGLTTHFQAMKLIDRLYDEQQFMLDLSEIIDYFYDTDYNRIDFGGFGTALIKVMVRHRIRIPRHYLLFLRSISMAQDSVQKLYPEINLIEQAKPYIEKILEEKTKPSYMLKSFRENYFEFQRFFRELPESVINIFKRMEEENLKVSLEATTIDELSHSLSRSTTTLSVSIVMAALILASAMLLNTSIPTPIGNTTELGAFGFVIVLLIGLYVVMRIIRA